MSKVFGLEEWDLSGVATAKQMATVEVFVAYPKLTDELARLIPKERIKALTQYMRSALDEVLALELLASHKLLGSFGRRGRYHGVRGSIHITDIQKLTALDRVDSIRIKSTNGNHIKPAKLRKRKSFYCVKMTVTIQIEGREQGMQNYEERYVLFKAYTEADALQQAEATTAEYGKPYLNSDGLLVRWKVESLDDVYEVTLADGSTSSLHGAEVFSVLKSRKINANRAWQLDNV